MGCTTSTVQAQIDVGEHTVAEVCSVLDSGDLLFVAGDNQVVRWATWSDWTHVLLVVRTDDGHACGLEAVRCADGSLDLLTGQRRAGARLVALNERLHCAGVALGRGVLRLCIVKLYCTDDERRLVRRRLLEFAEDVRAVPYERNWWSMVRAQFASLLGPNAHDTSSYFCSEIVAEGIARAGIVRSDAIVSSCITPRMLLEAGHTWRADEYALGRYGDEQVTLGALTLGGLAPSRPPAPAASLRSASAPGGGSWNLPASAAAGLTRRSPAAAAAAPPDVAPPYDYLDADDLFL
jgi:hypothetical protein